MAAMKWVYNFSGGKADGNAKMKSLLGGKGANLAEMTNIGLPVPPGFTITTEVCTAYYDNGRSLPDELQGQMEDAVAAIGELVGAQFGSVDNPLLVSVRSGARASMPGMMDTVLNLGLNDETVEGLGARANDMGFAYDSYRRFIQMYSDVVLGIEHGVFEDILDAHKNLNGFGSDTELEASDWKKIVDQFLELVESELDEPFPQDPHAQLMGAVEAVFGSWQNARANTYRRLHGIPDNWGTAVNVQAMVFGNLGNNSATGVAFTRDPSTGQNIYYGEFLVNAQGEDVVSGIRTPHSLTTAGQKKGDVGTSLEEVMPDAFLELTRNFRTLEAHYGDMQDIEFTIQDGKLWMLQTRDGKRTTRAAIRIAVDMVDEGTIEKEEAVLRIEPSRLDQILHPTVDPAAKVRVIAKGLPASPGAATGEIVFSASDAEAMKLQGRQVILVRTETSPEDIHGMHAAEGILTSRGGITSHAAVVARGMGRPCISGAGMVKIDYASDQMTVMGKVYSMGDVITIDGSSGVVMDGAVPMRAPELSDEYIKLMSWADEIRRLKVRANAETPADVRQAFEFGAEGIGLCRTEHMFFDSNRIMKVCEMILAEDEKGRRAALSSLLPMQRDDFTEIFKIMAGLPVTIRLLDPPLHEFLPREDEEIAKLSEAINVPEKKIRRRMAALHEFNPMLGHRGCRLAISYPEIIEMQTRAIFEAAIIAAAASSDAVEPEIMVPLVGYVEEFTAVKAVIDRVAGEVMGDKDVKIAYHVGTMIELPRAALRAGDIAADAEFFSFGTNDLTQTTLGLSRDDASSIISTYEMKEIISVDPFASIDKSGVGELVRMGVERGRAVRADLKLGVCGEHGGDPASIDFFEDVGLDYISCSPFRVPIARLAAAHAKIKSTKASG